MAVLPPPNPDEPLLTDAQAPVWSGRGGELPAAKVYAFQAFQKQFQRNPTQSELNLLAPAYVGADWNIANVAGGEAAVSQYYLQLSQANKPAPTAPPPSQAADNMDSSAVGIAAPATSSPGGSTSAFASQYTPNFMVGGGTPAVAAPASDKSALIWVLVGAALFFSMMKKSHG